MGAFDGELARIGYKTYSVKSLQPSEEESSKEEFRESLHVAEYYGCPGSCGAACPNHHCSNHNGEPFKRPKSKLMFGALGSDPLPDWMRGLSRKRK